MSRTNNTDRPRNPATMFIKWGSDAKSWTTYVKDDNGGHTINIPVETPFIVLDQLQTVSGFDESSGTGFWGNEVRHNDDLITLKSGKKTVMTGTWAEIKSTTGTKFTSSIYAMAKIDGEYKMVNFQLSGAALSGWFDFLESIGGKGKVYGDNVIAVTSTEEGKKGRVTFSIPRFEIISTSLSDEAHDQADAMDRTLQEYLGTYIEQKTSPAYDEDEPEEQTKDDGGFQTDPEDNLDMGGAPVDDDDPDSLPF